MSVRSNSLHELHQKIVKEVSPSEVSIKQYFELDDFVPHLTLGKAQYGGNVSTGLSKKELKEMERLADIELTPYPQFEVNFIRVYELNNGKQRYERHLDISLSN